MKYLTPCFVILAIFSCERPTNEETSQELNNCFPTVIIEAEKDTLTIGETFKAKVYLSDTSFYESVNWGDGKVGPTNAVFNVNGQITYSPGKNYLNYEEVVTDEPLFEEQPNLRQVEFGIFIPHPDTFGGDIEFSKLYTYVAVDKR